MTNRQRGPAAIIRPDWYIPEREATSEDAFLGRRALMRRLGLATIAGAALPQLVGCEAGRAQAPRPKAAPVPAEVSALYPAKRNPACTLDRPLTKESVAARYNNYYEFTTDKERVAELSKDFPVRPWSIEVTGLCHKPQRFDIDALVKLMPLEERLYRFRCVEAWSMAVPWTGFALSHLLSRVEPKANARFVRFVSFNKPELAVWQREQTWYPWPYFEGLTMAEAQNELTLLATGIYGHPLPPQHGAPIRLVVPWKYGFKSIKGIVRIELTDAQPPTFWNQLAASEYDFWGNVIPSQPHPRWSQASERDIETGERRMTLLYNGYATQVASLYKQG
jgi:sulfoxide reductase catalytic subunit YedY